MDRQSLLTIPVEAALPLAEVCTSASNVDALTRAAQDAMLVIEPSHIIAVEPFAAPASQQKILEKEKVVFSSYATQPLTLTKFHNAFLLGSKYALVTAAGKLVRETVPVFHHKPDPKWLERTKGFAENLYTNDSVEITAPVLLLANASAKNYWHWHVQALPNIVLLKRLGLLGKLKLLVPPLGAWQKASLRALGVEEEQLITLENRIYTLREVYVSSLTDKTRQVFQHPIVAETFRQIAQAHAGVGQHKKVYISRFDNDARRPMSNEPQLAETLRTLGFHIIVPGVMSYAEQVEALKGAELVVGAHGAGMTNVAFAPAGARVVELFPRYFFYDEKLALYVQSQLCSQHYRGYISREYTGEWEGQSPKFNSNATWRVDIADCMRFIRLN